MMELLPTALKAAVIAGNAVLEVYQKGFTVVEKTDNSPLTQADTRSHAIIRDHLQDTDIPILSEEGRDIGYPERKQWKRLWIVDPLDGTKEFVKRNDEFTVNIALAEDRVPVMGVIYVPVLSRLYWGLQGQGAFRAELREPERISSLPVEKILEAATAIMVNRDRSRPYTIVGSRSHLTAEVETFVEEKRKQVGEVAFVSAGSSLKFCQVAEGAADIYPRLGPTMEWDTAAGHIIAKAAGASVTRHDTGDELLYNKENLTNPWFIVSNERGK